MVNTGRDYISLKEMPNKFNEMMAANGYKNWSMIQGPSNLEEMNKKNILGVKECPKGPIGDELEKDERMTLSVFLKFGKGSKKWTSACGNMTLVVKKKKNKINVHWKVWGQAQKNSKKTEYIDPTHIASLDYVCSMLKRTYCTGFTDNNGSDSHGVRHNMRKSHDTFRCQACAAGVCRFIKQV